MTDNTTERLVRIETRLDMVIDRLQAIERTGQAASSTALEAARSEQKLEDRVATLETDVASTDKLQTRILWLIIVALTGYVMRAIGGSNLMGLIK